MNPRDFILRVKKNQLIIKPITSKILRMKDFKIENEKKKTKIRR